MSLHGNRQILIPPALPHLLAIAEREEIPDTLASFSKPSNAAIKALLEETLLSSLSRDTEGQDVVEYAIMLAVIVVIVMGVVKMIGSNAGLVFSQVSSAMQ